VAAGDFFESAAADERVYCRDERVRLPLLALGLLTPDGVPFVRPEVVLLYRAANAPAAIDDADVREVADKLSAAGRKWLIDALTTAHPGHRWIGQI
jgi:hypothetical protein